MRWFWFRLMPVLLTPMVLTSCARQWLPIADRTAAPSVAGPRRVKPKPRLSKKTPNVQLAANSTLKTCSTRGEPNFLVLSGGGAPSYNEIAIEKNVLYFQRTLSALGITPKAARIYFANGNDGEKTVRYLDEQGDEQFKSPDIPGIIGPATWPNLQSAIAESVPPRSSLPLSTPGPSKPLFFYFTGHGSHNDNNPDNNAMILWNERPVSVQQFTAMLDRLPETTPVVTVMVQCYAGAFANMIYQKGDPKRPVALQTRCGFFATVKELPSVGCTPAVDEADYQDYSSSFFAGLSGVNRVGKPVATADYDRDGRVAFNEAHGFAKVDEQASDLPISTSESWLREQFSAAETAAMLMQPIASIRATGRPEQRYVVDAFSQRFKFDVQRSFNQNRAKLPIATKADEQQQVYITRLQLELINIAAEQQLRSRPNNAAAIAVLDRLIQCESGSWDAKRPRDVKTTRDDKARSVVPPQRSPVRP
jgi:hypothetical protein